MSVISILAKLPNEVKERIENPTALRINNDFPGLFVPKEDSEDLKDLLNDLRGELEKKNQTDKVKRQIKLVNNMTSIIDRKILDR
jgi:hypothetical protein